MQPKSRFQWASLQITYLLSLKRLRDIRVHLGKLPKDLKTAYDNIYTEIKEDETIAEIANRAFQWVMGSVRPLSAAELVAAICQDPEKDTLEPVDTVMDDVLGACRNLLVVDPKLDVCRFSHLSVREYFEEHHWTTSYAIGQVEKVCLLVLHSTDNWERYYYSHRHGCCDGDDHIYKFDEADPLIRYVRNKSLEHLPNAFQAGFNSYDKGHKPFCLPETRVDVLEKIERWADGVQDNSIFWLNGMAGTGKSTIARTVARKYHGQKRLGASFFFSRASRDVNHAGKFIISIAIQLANKSSPLTRYICQAIANCPDIGMRALGEQWDQLILRPLSKLKASQLPSSSIVIVIDALDECEHEGDIPVILQLLAKTQMLTRVRLRIFITSRPEHTIVRSFYEIPNTTYLGFRLHEISLSVVNHDMSIFIRHELEKIKEERGFSPEWPGEQTIEFLVEKAGSLFIYAATLCRFIERSRFPPRRLKQVTQGATPDAVHMVLGNMYNDVLSQSLEGFDDEEKSELNRPFRRVVGGIVILFDSLSAPSLAQLLSVELVDVYDILRSFHSILDIPEDRISPIRLLHHSFRDFLLDEKRCHPQFRINEKNAHSDLVDSCIKVMSKFLKKDMCGLQMPGTLTSEVERNTVSRCLPEGVQYACRYWIYHLQESEIGLCGDNGQIYQFLQKHFLHWLEALSLMGKMSEGVLMITALQSMCTVSDLVPLRYDFRR
jgi:hypothetical protein